MKLQTEQSCTSKEKKVFDDLIYKVILWSYEHGSRSPKRTDEAHHSFMDILQGISQPDGQSLLSPFEVRHEVKVSNPDEPKHKFKVDVQLVSPPCNIALLFKFVASSYNKNRYNYGNTIIGERFRYLANSGGKQRKLAHINILPKRCPVFERNGKIKNIEKTKLGDVSTYLDHCLFVNDPIELQLIFEIDLELLKKAKSRSELCSLMKEAGSSCITVADEEFISKLSQFIRT